MSVILTLTLIYSRLTSPHLRLPPALHLPSPLLCENLILTPNHHISPPLSPSFSSLPIITHPPPTPSDSPLTPYPDPLLLSPGGAIYYGLGSGALSYFEKLSRTPSPGARYTPTYV